MAEDILDRLRLDPGHRTLGQLLQDREAAFQEIRRLREDAARLQSMRTAAQRPPVVEPPAQGTKASHPMLKPGTLVTVRQLCAIINVSHTTIYRWIGSGNFPQPVRISRFAVRWKAEEIIAWQDSLSRGVA